MAQQSINAFDRRRYAPQNDSINNAVVASTEQTIGITDIISEGPIAGRVNGTASVFLNGDPMDTDSTATYMDESTEVTLVEGQKNVSVSLNGSIFTATTNEFGKRFLKVFSTSVVDLSYIFDASDIETGKFYNIHTVGNTDWTSIGAGNAITAGNFVEGTQYTIKTTGSTNFVALGAADNNPGTEFKATGSGSGTGEAYQWYVGKGFTATGNGSGTGKATSIGTKTYGTGFAINVVPKIGYKKTATSADTLDDAWNTPDNRASFDTKKILDGTNVHNWINAEGAVQEDVTLRDINETKQVVWVEGASFMQAASPVFEKGGDDLVTQLKTDTFFEIESISSNTITLKNNVPSGYAGTYKFSITAPVGKDDTLNNGLDQSSRYQGAQAVFANGTLDQGPKANLEGIGTSSVALSVQNAALEKFVPANSNYTTISASGAQASEIDEVKIIIQYPQGVYIQSASSGSLYTAGVAYHIEIAINTGTGTPQYITIPPPNPQYFFTAGEYEHDASTEADTPVWNLAKKQKSKFSTEYRINLENLQPFVGFTLRISRLTKHDSEDFSSINPFGGASDAYNRAGGIDSKLQHAEGGQSRAQNGGQDGKHLMGVYTSSVTQALGIIKEKLNFPYTAYANIQFSSKTFQSAPTRAYECRGMKVKVPSNYITREELNDGTLTAKYTRNSETALISAMTKPQLWDGTFRMEADGVTPKLIYTDNPAWVFYDICTNNRYGLGDYLRESDIDKFSLYKVAKYCDELVPDGKGGLEPRFRANIYLTKSTDAYKILKDFATVFRGILYWSNSQFTTVIDEPKEPIYTFSRSNVIDGQFEYQSSGNRTRINQVVVSWNNPENEYKIEPIIVEDRENIIKTGSVKSEKAMAFGCTSEGQAIRYGRWKLWTSINQTELVSFKTGINAAFLTPGDIVNIQDEADFRVPFSGRVNTCTSSSITIDREIKSHFANGYEYTISVIIPKKTVVLNQDIATLDNAAGTTTTFVRGDEITHAAVWTGHSSSTTVSLIQRTTASVNGAVNNSVNVTLSSSNSAITVGDTITGAGVDKNITVAGISGTSLTLSAAQTISDTTSLIFENEDTTRRNIESAVDTSGSSVNLQYIEQTIVEERILNTGSASTSDSRDTIPFYGAAFSTTPSSGDIWAIKQISTSDDTVHAASYKQYKILDIAESNKTEYAITAVEHYNTKFDLVDKDFSPATSDPLFPREESTVAVPKPTNLRLLRTPMDTSPGEELTMEWDAPLASTAPQFGMFGFQWISTAFGTGHIDFPFIAEYEIEHTFGPESGLVSGSRVPSTQQSQLFTNVPNGNHVVSVCTISKAGRRSEKALFNINIEDIFEGAHERLGGILKGGYSTKDVFMVETGTEKGTLKFSEKSYKAAPFTAIQKAKSNTTADADSYSISCTPLANAAYTEEDPAYVMMDFSVLDASAPNANALKLVARRLDSSTFGSTIDYWYDVTKYVASASSIWTNSGLGTVSVTQGSSKIVGTGFSTLNIPEVVTIGNSFAGKVALIVSNTVMYLDRPWTASSATGQTLKKQELSIDYQEDFLVSAVSYSSSGGGTYFLGGSSGGMSYLEITKDLTSVARSVVVTSNVPSLQYAADNSQETSYSNIQLTMSAVNFEEPEFNVTGAGFSQVNTSADGGTSYTASSSGVLTKTVHTDSSAIAYSATPLEFTIKVRDALDPDNTNKQVTATHSIGKIREGAQGNSTALVYLYKNSTSDPGADDIGSSFPVVTVTLSGPNAGTITGAVGGISEDQIGSTGWFIKPQTITGDNKQWVVAATANATTSTDTISYNEWSDPVQFSGADGANGLNSATVEIWKLTNSNTETSKPSGNSTYTFKDESTGKPALSFTTANGWIYNPNTAQATPVSNNKYLWKRTGAAVSTAATDVIGTTEWSDPIIAAQYGVVGDPGKKTLTALFYKAAPTANDNQIGKPFTSGTKTFTFSDNTFDSAISGWSFTPPTFDASGDAYYWVSTFTVEEGTADSGTATVSPSNFTNPTVVQNFSGVVAFSDINQDTSTVIHGSNITTGVIKNSATITDSDELDGTDFVGNGEFVINLDNGTINSPKFKIKGSTGDAEFKGKVKGASFNGDNTVDSDGNIKIGTKMTIEGSGERIIIKDASSNTRVILGKLTS